MNRIVVQPYKIRENKFVPVQEHSLELDWQSYKGLLAPSGSKNALLLLRKVQVGSYIGLLKNNKNQLVNFLYVPSDTRNKTSPLNKQIPDLEKRLVSLYKVLSVDFGSRVIE